MLTYHISLTAQGVPLRCPTCKADDMWSPESRPDSTEIDYYLCLGCQQYRVDEQVVMGRIVADPKVDSLLVTFGDLLEDILYEQHHWAAAASNGQMNRSGGCFIRRLLVRPDPTRQVVQQVERGLRQPTVVCSV